MNTDDKTYKIHLGYFAGHKLKNKPAAYCINYQVDEQQNRMITGDVDTSNKTNSANACVIASIHIILDSIVQSLQSLQFDGNANVGLLTLCFIHERKYVTDILNRVMELDMIFQHNKVTDVDEMYVVSDIYFSTTRNRLKTKHDITEMVIKIQQIRSYVEGFVMVETRGDNSPLLKEAMTQARGMAIIKSIRSTKSNVSKPNFRNQSDRRHNE